MPRILLPLLLCLSLIAGTVGAAWTATAMAAPAQASAQHDMDHACCADGGGHGQPAKQACGEGSHCDCMQHCNLLPAPVVAQLAALPCSPEPTALRLLRHDVTPDRLHRPPIA
ncbi:hypothetical protein ABB34_09075 [Stenotrophomonas daejeonensis]|uniref:CopL family metal-binding regulatory protein n=1 Tax=Stenotrophomonas daejeonensis TaxID=659018 RepID=A0A0R0DS93_9GAMM|nr:CopL family metal-binding regulatory protein [Stenotrophomonas daejeonensis]KRG84496.1 hypothetical protein ABB34_09075 [Stenotrophomonas daejeonensis]